MDDNLVKNQYSLSIWISSDGFSLSIFDEKHHIISSKNVKSEQGEDKIDFLLRSIASQEVINAEYKLTSFIYESIYHTIIPEIFYSIDNETEFLKLHHPSLPPSCRVFCEKQADLKTALIFGIEGKVIEIIHEHFHAASITSHLAHLIKRLGSDKHDKLVVWIREEEIDCIVYKNNKILLLNKYSYHNSEDILYHILNIYQQFTLNPSSFITEIYDDMNTFNKMDINDYIHTANITTKQSVYENYQWEI